MPAALPEKVLLVTVSVPRFEMPPPSLPEKVLSVTVSVPRSLNMGTSLQLAMVRFWIELRSRHRWWCRR